MSYLLFMVYKETTAITKILANTIYVVPLTWKTNAFNFVLQYILNHFLYK